MRIACKPGALPAWTLLVLIEGGQHNGGAAIVKIECGVECNTAVSFVHRAEEVVGYVLLWLQVAFDNSIDKHRVTPYSRAATEAFDMVYSGGKPDDITVLVAVIS